MSAWQKSPSKPRSFKAYRERVDARPDTLDFRDRMYVPTLVEVPEEINLSDYRKRKLPVLDQGTEGA